MQARIKSRSYTKVDDDKRQLVIDFMLRNQNISIRTVA